MMKYLNKFARTPLFLLLLITNLSHSLVTKETLINHLFDIGAIKFGNFTLKSGKSSPFYIDARLLVSHPYVLEEVVESLWQVAQRCEYDHICGVPYSGLVIASALCVMHHQPMLLKRKETKDHGTKKMVEGIYKTNDRCLVIEDIMTTGQSILETTADLEAHELVIKDVIVLIDREQSGEEYVCHKGYRVHSLLTISEIADHLYRTARITGDQHECLLSSIQRH